VGRNHGGKRELGVPEREPIALLYGLGEA